MADESEIAHLTALAERLCADKISIRQVAVIDDICVAAHGTELHQAAPAENFRVDACRLLIIIYHNRFAMRNGGEPGDAGVDSTHKTISLSFCP